MIVDAPAKLNLFLRVLAREAGGFHQIETLFCALELADELEIERSTLGIEIDTTFDIPTHENIVYRAATAFFRQSGLDGGARSDAPVNHRPGRVIGSARIREVRVCDGGIDGFRRCDEDDVSHGKRLERQHARAAPPCECERRSAEKERDVAPERCCDLD
jgi:hypothetical protein